MGGWWRWALVSPDGVAPIRMVGVSASINLPLHHKVQNFSSGTGSPGCSQKKGCKTVVVSKSPSNTMSPGSRSTSLPSGILIYPAIWPQQTLAKNWVCAPFGEAELGLHLTQCRWDEAYLHAKFHPDPSNRLATMYQRHRQDTQRSDSIGRTILQMVTQKLKPGLVAPTPSGLDTERAYSGFSTS